MLVRTQNWSLLSAMCLPRVMRIRRQSWLMTSRSFYLTSSSNRRACITECRMFVSSMGCCPYQISQISVTILNGYKRISIVKRDVLKGMHDTLGYQDDANMSDDLGCCSVQYFGCVPAFQRNILLPSSGLKRRK
jgi:hypothetical protein